jgi:2'-5' RNA ligase
LAAPRGSRWTGDAGGNLASLKAAITALPDRELQNRLTAAALEVHGLTSGRLRWPRLPPHVSLKQPFLIESLAAVEAYFDRLVASTAPLDVTLGAVEVRPSSLHAPDGVVWVNIVDSAPLRTVHERLNHDLGEVVQDATAPFDGAPYRFHVTLGFLPTLDLILPQGGTAFWGETTTFRELGLFLYDGMHQPGWQAIRYKTLPLSPPR